MSEKDRLISEYLDREAFVNYDVFEEIVTNEGLAVMTISPATQ
ncbi:MAG: hypothetical protein WDO71_19435 [Bacteroidota bacterium]